MSIHGWGQGIDYGDKATGKAISYAAKAAYLSAFHLRGQPDNEGDDIRRSKPPVATITAKEQEYIDDALKEIAACDDFKFLRDMGLKFKKQSAAVQNKLRPQYEIRYSTLKPPAAAADVGDGPPY